ncbi:hypothetical protein [Promicromonospora sp. NPDC023805]|uniref:class I fructose-bisphosphate aldolase n=1 Tax=Promicromonospora sp. NPDC023805 TaxID=3154696 RepID=UPI00340B3DFA
MRRLRNAAGSYLFAVLDDGYVSGPHENQAAAGAVASTAHALGFSAVMGYPGFFRSQFSDIPSVGRVVNVAGSTVRHDVASKVIVTSVAEAIRCAADAVAVHVSLGVPNEGVMLAQLGHVVADAHGFGLPVLAASYARSQDGVPILDASQQAHAARCALELGADIIKVPWPGSRDGLRRIVAAVDPLPVVLAGGPPGPDSETTSRVAEAKEAGVSGLCIGRRLLSASNPASTITQIVEIFER